MNSQDKLFPLIITVCLVALGTNEYVTQVVLEWCNELLLTSEYSVKTLRNLLTFHYFVEFLNSRHFLGHKCWRKKIISNSKQCNLLVWKTPNI